MKKEDLKYHPPDENGNPYCIDDFIKDLQKISPGKRKLPLFVTSPNGLSWTPEIKMVFEDDIMIGGELIAMTITY